MGDTALCPYDAGTFGSRTTPAMAPQLRKAAAAARERLIDLGAAHWTADRATIAAADGKITDRATGKSLGFGTLTQGRKLMEVIGEDAATTPPRNGRSPASRSPRSTAASFVTGRHTYSSDVKRPGMLHGKVLRPPAYDAVLSSVDTSRAEAMPGVVVVHEGPFVGVVAPDEATAARALARDPGRMDNPRRRIRSRPVRFIQVAARPGPGERGRFAARRAWFDQRWAWPAADVRVERTYTIAYIAHAPLEPRPPSPSGNRRN